MDHMNTLLGDSEAMAQISESYLQSQLFNLLLMSSWANKPLTCFELLIPYLWKSKDKSFILCDPYCALWECWGDSLSQIRSI